MYEPPIKLLENWCLADKADGNLMLPPEESTAQLQGEVYHHEKFEPGHYIKTSHITGFDRERNLVITASGSRYQLGDPDPRYEEKFPDAKRRFLAHVKEGAPDSPNATRAAQRPK